ISMEAEDEAADAMGDEPAEDGIDTVEVSLGNYNPTNSLGVGIVHVAFDLTAIAAADNEQALKVAFLETHGARIRSAVIRVIRSSNLEDLNDPESYVIKRKIREEINKVLPKTLIIEVVMDKFRLMPQ
ncbi:MAG: flagellar basal body-associated FliL family protein, partial [Planctomycetaceae bacterium]|nr:flagellar basal body-associated FliL family protein [Planctomycetaceae bacterium]